MKDDQIARQPANMKCPLARPVAASPVASWAEQNSEPCQRRAPVTKNGKSRDDQRAEFGPA